MTKRELRALLPNRSPEDHKGRHGHVLIVAGSPGMAGAAVLSARAALRSGAGLVTLALPQNLQKMAWISTPEALTLGLPEGRSGALGPAALPVLMESHAGKNYTVLALGPGLSLDRGAGQLVTRLLRALPIPALVDADALNHLAALGPTASARLMKSRSSPSIATPHPGEMSRCLRQSGPEILRNREAAALALSNLWRAACVLKGRRSVISWGKRVAVNPTGGSGLAKGGSGDVLTGLIAGLWAQMLSHDPGARDSGFRAAALGAYLHGLAGDIAQKDLSAWAMTAQDVIERFPRAFLALARE